MQQAGQAANIMVFVVKLLHIGRSTVPEVGIPRLYIFVDLFEKL